MSSSVSTQNITTTFLTVWKTDKREAKARKVLKLSETYARGAKFTDKYDHVIDELTRINLDMATTVELQKTNGTIAKMQDDMNKRFDKLEKMILGRDGTSMEPREKSVEDQPAN